MYGRSSPNLQVQYTVNGKGLSTEKRVGKRPRLSRSSRSSSSRSVLSSVRLHIAAAIPAGLGPDSSLVWHEGERRSSGRQTRIRPAYQVPETSPRYMRPERQSMLFRPPQSFRRRQALWLQKSVCCIWHLARSPLVRPPRLRKRSLRPGWRLCRCRFGTAESFEQSKFLAQAISVRVVCSSCWLLAGSR